MKKSEIQIRDPYILVENGVYYLFGTTDKTCWAGKGDSFLCYQSRDLENFEDPCYAFKPSPDFWADQNFWAPEVHKYQDQFYMFASFKSDNRCRGTQILVSDKPEGPYIPLTDAPYTPSSWECLDGTFYVENGVPYSVFAHEWTQINDGTFCVVQLSPDLKSTIGDPQTIFKASEAPWTVSHAQREGAACYVTDGAFIHKMSDGSLVMIWSSFSSTGYAVGQAKSVHGISGPWIHAEKPVFQDDGGHSMIFKSLDGRLFMTLHQPNNSPMERPYFFEIIEKEGLLELKFPAHSS